MGYKLIQLCFKSCNFMQLLLKIVETCRTMLTYVETINLQKIKSKSDTTYQHIQRIKQTHEEKHTTNIKTPVFLGHRQALGARPGGLSNWAGDYGPVDPPGSDGRFTGSNCDSWGMLGEYEPKVFKFELNHGANVLQMYCKCVIISKCIQF